MKLCVLLMVLALLCGATIVRAQEGEYYSQYESCFDAGVVDTTAVTHAGALLEGVPQPAGPAWHSMITNIPGDWYRSGKLIFRSQSLPSLAGIAVATGALLVTDHETQQASLSFYDESPAIHSASDAFVHVGDGKTAFGIAAAFALYGVASGDHRAFATGSQTVEAVLASGIVVQLLKRVAGRESPEMASVHRGRWRPFRNWGTYNHHQPRYYAFPSGHVTTTMAVVTVLAENYPEVGWIRPVGYAVTGLVGISLVNVGWHWYSDFPLAVALGYSFGMIAAHRNDVDGDGDGMADGKGLRVMPNISRAGTGVLLAWNF
jgi:hypothetical protein